MRKGFNEFCRRMRIKWNFKNEPSQDFSETPAFRVKSSWKPAKDHPNLEVFLSKIEENFLWLLKILWIILILLKLVSPIFYHFFFSPNDSPSKTMKSDFISSKKLFPFSRYSNFCIFSLPFPTLQTQNDNGSGMVYDVMNWLA